MKAKNNSNFFQKNDEKVILKNDLEVNRTTVNRVIQNLDFLRQYETHTFYEFVQQCRLPNEKILDPKQLPFSLVYRHLVDLEGKISEETKAIVVSSIVDNGINIRMESPLKENEINSTKNI